MIYLFSHSFSNLDTVIASESYGKGDILEEMSISSILATGNLEGFLSRWVQTEELYQLSW